MSLSLYVCVGFVVDNQKRKWFFKSSPKAQEIAGQARDDGVEVGLCTSETGSPTLVWVGRGGMADMAGKRPLCGEDRWCRPWFFGPFSSRRKGKKTDGSAKHRSQATARVHAGMTCFTEPAGTQRIFLCALAGSQKSCNFAGRKQPVMGCVPNFGEVTDYMAGLFFISLQSYSHSTECVCLQSSLQ